MKQPVDIHPACMVCLNCYQIRPKRGSYLFQNEDGSPIVFCGECGKELIEALELDSHLTED